MKILHLTLKKKWFDMIASGEKKEEYREIKPYWFRRLVLKGKDALIEPWTESIKNKNLAARWNFDNYYYGKTFDTIVFKNGYSKDAPTITIQFKGISIGKAKPEWSDNWQGEVFVIKLGKKLTTL